MKPEPKSYMTDAERAKLRADGASENCILLTESGAASKAGDEDSAWGWLAKADLPAYSLAYLKVRRGAQFIREWGFKTGDADAAYGQGWLERA